MPEVAGLSPARPSHNLKGIHMKKKLTVTLEKELVDRVNKECGRFGLSQRGAIQEALECWFASTQPDVPAQPRIKKIGRLFDFLPDFKRGS